MLKGIYLVASIKIQQCIIKYSIQWNPNNHEPTNTFDGVLVIVQTGYVLGAGLGWHS